MPAADDAKTKSGHKTLERETPPLSAPAKSNTFWRTALPWATSKKTLLYALGVCLALLAVLAPMVFFQPATATLQLGAKTYTLDIATTPQKRALGLGGRTSLPTDAGMVFVFEQSQPECFWMKDMHFPIDIIWLNEVKRVVHVERNVSPDTYPNSFCPVTPAKYVIELGAGQANDVKLGQTLRF